MLLDGHAHAGGSEYPSPHLEIPGVETPAAEDGRLPQTELPLEPDKPLGRRRPVLAPDLEVARHRECEHPGSARPPGREPMPQPTVEANGRLEEMKVRDDQGRLHPLGTRSARSGQGGPSCPRSPPRRASTATASRTNENGTPRAGTAKRSGCAANPYTVIAASAAIRRCHSGMRGSEASVLGARS